MAEYFNVAEWKIQEWERDYSPLNVRQELNKMYNWLDANPKRRKKNYTRFAVNWLNKAHASIVVAQVNARIGSQIGKFDPNGNNGRAVLSASDREWYKENGL